MSEKGLTPEEKQELEYLVSKMPRSVIDILNECNRRAKIEDWRISLKDALHTAFMAARTYQKNGWYYTGMCSTKLKFENQVRIHGVPWSTKVEYIHDGCNCNRMRITLDGWYMFNLMNDVVRFIDHPELLFSNKIDRKILNLDDISSEDLHKYYFVEKLYKMNDKYSFQDISDNEHWRNFTGHPEFGINTISLKSCLFSEDDSEKFGYDRTYKPIFTIDINYVDTDDEINWDNSIIKIIEELHTDLWNTTYMFMEFIAEQNVTEESVSRDAEVRWNKVYYKLYNYPETSDYTTFGSRHVMSYLNNLKLAQMNLKCGECNYYNHREDLSHIEIDDDSKPVYGLYKDYIGEHVRRDFFLNEFVHRCYKYIHEYDDEERVRLYNDLVDACNEYIRTDCDIDGDRDTFTWNEKLDVDELRAQYKSYLDEEDEDD